MAESEITKEINGEETGPKKDPKTGRFVKGGPGGPGRGKKKQALSEADIDSLDFWELAESSFREHLKSSDPDLHLKALKAFMKFEEMRQKFRLNNRKTTLHPFVNEFLSKYMGDALGEDNLIDHDAEDIAEDEDY